MGDQQENGKTRQASKQKPEATTRSIGLSDVNRLESGVGLGLEHLAATIKAGWTDVVAQMGLA